MRWSALILIALMMFFGYMFVDLMSPLQSMVEAQRGWSPDVFGTYAASEYILNVFGFLIVAGIILDKMGVRFTGTLSASLMFVGAAIKFYGVSDWFIGSGLEAWLDSWWTSMPASAKMASLGFMIFGCGCEMAGITVSRAIAKWFKGKEMALAMGLEMAIARVGVFAIFTMSPAIADSALFAFIPTQVVKPVFLCTAFLLIGLICFLTFCVMDRKLDRQLGDEAASGSSADEEFKVSDIKIILSSKIFWIVAMLCVLYINVSIQPFYQQNTLIGAFCVFQQAQDREKRQQKARRQIPAGGHMTKYTFDSIIGESRPMQTAKDLARKMAASSAAILITGESGTGKELFAQAIHAASPRSGSPFVAINCAAMPDSLLESQLFGYEEGAFTGAKKGGHIGFFETACSGTLFLDEIEAMSPMLQVKLLRVLQEKEIVRLGGVDVIHVDVRVIAASNEDLSTIVREGGFRKDLFYRLSVLPLQLPPLRERGLDIQLLLRHIQDNMHASFILSSEALRVLLSYQWEGNVRELRNCVEYLICLEKQVIQPEDLPFNIQASFAHERTIEPQPVPEPAPVRPDAAGQALEQLRRRAGSDLTPYRFLLAQLVLVPSMGRKALSEQAARSGLTLTEQTIRTMMSHLEELKLVEIRRGRGGTQITALGREAARALAAQPIKSPI